MSDKDILLAAIKENPQWGEKLNWKAEIDPSWAMTFTTCHG